MATTIEKLLSILSSATSKDNLVNIDLDKPMKDQGIDSLDTISFFFSVEKEFDIKISIDEQNQLNSLNDILNYLNNLK